LSAVGRVGRIGGPGLPGQVPAVTCDLAEGRPPFQTQIGMPVSSNALPLLYPGNNVPGKRLEIDDHHVMIDWDAALSEATARPGAPV
ncbi:MAG: hypothetical protein WAK93_06615, partial [Solirubrobacteraceae bacterium]